MSEQCAAPYCREEGRVIHMTKDGKRFEVCHKHDNWGIDEAIKRDKVLTNE